MKKIEVTAIGELLIDFTENGVSNQGNPLFEATTKKGALRVMPAIEDVQNALL